MVNECINRSKSKQNTMEENIRKFKLIKEYPGSPKLNTIVDNRGVYVYFDTNNPNMNNTFSKEDIENHPSFWEEVKEKPKKEYEILRMKNQGGCVFYINSDNEIGNYELKYHYIQSIKRLSDGAIFSIGDNVTLFGWKHTNCFIEGFKISDKIDLLGITIRQKDATSTYYNGLDTLRKVERVPLFKTEDGVNIYENDKFWFVVVNSNTNSYDRLWEVCTPHKDDFVYEPEFDKYFSTKEKALEYIIENKPCLSYNDIKDIAFGLFMNVNSGRAFFNEEAVKELVKSKLK